MIFVWLHIHNLYEQYISWLRSLYFKSAGEVVDSGQIDGLHIVGTVIVP